MAITPEAQARLQVLRDKSRAGTITTDELKEGIAMIREDRISAAATSKTARATTGAARAKAKAPPPNSASLLSELEGL